MNPLKDYGDFQRFVRAILFWTRGHIKELNVDLIRKICEFFEFLGIVKLFTWNYLIKISFFLLLFHIIKFGRIIRMVIGIRRISWEAGKRKRSYPTTIPAITIKLIRLKGTEQEANSKHIACNLKSKLI